MNSSSFSSVKAVDVVTYLAFHRQGVDADQIKTWVWPSFEPPTDKALANVLSRARTGLGAGEDGTPYDPVALRPLYGIESRHEESRKNERASRQSRHQWR